MSNYTKKKSTKNRNRKSTRINRKVSSLYQNIIKDNINEKKKIVVSHYNDNINIFHIFVKEIMGIWKYTKGDVNTILILKNYENNTLNNWRLNLLKKLFKNVYTNTIPIYINQSNYTITTLSHLILKISLYFSATTFLC